MMMLQETFETLCPSVVAFIAKARLSPEGKTPLAPIIFGTGFLVHKDGLVATNRHVVETFERVPKNPKTGEFGVAAILFAPGTDEASVPYMRWAIVDIEGHSTLGQFSSNAPWYGEGVPDIGFVQLRIRETPFVKLATEDFYLRIGMPIATAGFPLGDRPLTVMEKLNQLTPFLRRGIVSSLYPFSIRHPHGFTIDIMQQGGSSGSPIFREDEPVVVGMMAASILDHSVIANETLALRVSQNSNISIAVPSATIQGALDSFRSTYPQEVAGFQTLKDYLKEKPTEPGTGWEILGVIS